MSHADAKAFVERVSNDEALSRELIGVRDGGVEAPEQLIDLGARHGFTFTAIELADVVAEVKLGHAELRETELEAMSGGVLETELESRKLSTLSSVSRARFDLLYNSISNMK